MCMYVDYCVCCLLKSAHKNGTKASKKPNSKEND